MFVRRFLAIALALAALRVLPAKANDLTIGFIGDLTGADANLAQDQLDGFRLGLKHAGGKLAGNDVTLVALDGHRDARATQRQVEHLVQADRTQVVLASVTAGSLPGLVPVAQAGRSLLLSLQAPPASMAGKDCQAGVFSLSSAIDSGPDLTGLLMQQRGYKTVAVVGLDGAEFRAAVNALRHAFKGTLAEVTGRRGEMSFASDLQRIRELAPDAVYVAYKGGMAVNFVRRFAETMSGERPVLAGPSAVFDQGVLAAAGQAAVDFLTIAPWSEDVDSPVNKRFMQEFETDYGRPASLHAAIGYDAAMVLDAAFKTLDKRTNDEDALRNALRHVDFPSPRGVLRFDSNQFPIENLLLRQAVMDQRGRIVNEQRGTFLQAARDPHAGECGMRWPADTVPKK